MLPILDTIKVSGRAIKRLPGGRGAEGRPQGTASKLLSMAREGALELWPSIMQAARDEDMEAVKLVLATALAGALCPVHEVEGIHVRINRSIRGICRNPLWGNGFPYYGWFCATVVSVGRPFSSYSMSRAQSASAMDASNSLDPGEKERSVQ